MNQLLSATNGAHRPAWQTLWFWPQHLARIERAARRIDQLIVGVLAYSRLTRGRPDLRPVDLGETVRDMLQTYPDFQSLCADITIAGRLPIVNGNDALLTAGLLQPAAQCDEVRRARVNARPGSNGGDGRKLNSDLRPRAPAIFVRHEHTRAISGRANERG